MKPMSRWLAIGLTTASVLWLLALLAAPFGVGDGSVAAWFVYQAGGSICHQRPERSFYLAGAPMPVCARCFGLYASGAVAALGAWAIVPRHDWSTRQSRVVLCIAALPTAVTLAVEWFGLAASSPLVRALAALPLGGGAGWVFVRALRTEEPVPHSSDAL
jgi:uncharacterized membrane protein